MNNIKVLINIELQGVMLDSLWVDVVDNCSLFVRQYVDQMTTEYTLNK